MLDHSLVLVLIAVLALVCLVGIYAFSPRRRSSPGERLVELVPARKHKLPVVIECGTCQHFDLEEGQAFMRQYPAFMGAAAVRSPAQMSEKAVLDAHGNVVGWNKDGPGGKVTPLKAKWDDFGACQLLSEGRYKHDVCASYERDDTKIEAAAMRSRNALEAS